MNFINSSLFLVKEKIITSSSTYFISFMIFFILYIKCFMILQTMNFKMLITTCQSYIELIKR